MNDLQTMTDEQIIQLYERLAADQQKARTTERSEAIFEIEMYWCNVRRQRLEKLWRWTDAELAAYDQETAAEAAANQAFFRMFWVNPEAK